MRVPASWLLAVGLVIATVGRAPVPTSSVSVTLPVPPPVPSVAVTVMVNVPDCIGVPLRTPLLLSARPVGRAPTSLKLYPVPAPPDAANVKLYGSFTVPVGGVAGVTTTAGLIVML